MANKLKLKWEYVIQPFDVAVYEPQKMVKRLHQQRLPSLSWNPDFGRRYLHLRPCVQGVDENGIVIKYLYCTRDGRFFVHKKDGWYELMPHNHSRLRRNKAVGGSAGCPQMREFGDKYCHRCVAIAWCNPPQEVIDQLQGIESDTKWEVDHLNGDHKNWTADNLQWVTDYENRRRAGIMKRMRKIGIDPRLLTSRQLKCIYSLIEKTVNLVNMPENLVDYFLNLFQGYCAIDPTPLSVEQIHKNTDYALLRIIRGLEAEGLDAISKQYEKLLNPNYQSL